MKSAPWIRLIAYQERPSFRQAPRADDVDACAHSRIGNRIVDQLRAAVAAEISTARHETNRAAMRIDDRPFGFQVTSTDTVASSRKLAVALVGRTVSCNYSIVTADVMLAKSRWVEFAADQRALAVWDQGVRRRFGGMEPLATFLIAAMSTFENAP